MYNHKRYGSPTGRMPRGPEMQYLSLPKSLLRVKLKPPIVDYAELELRILAAMLSEPQNGKCR